MGIELRDVVEADLPIFFEHQSDRETARLGALMSRDEEAFFAHWTTKVLGDDTVHKKTILVDGTVAGNVVSFEKDGVREVGYWLGRAFWGKGVATAALSAFLDSQGRPLYAHVAKRNVGSIRVLEKCGFTVVSEDRVSDEHGEDVEELLMKLDT